MEETRKERELRLSRVRNARYRGNMSDEAKRKKKNRDTASRHAIKKERLVENDQLFLKGKRICSICFNKKTLTEYSENRRTLEKKYNKICDECLIKAYKRTSYSPDTFTPEFWRKKAYSCNTTAFARFKKTKGVKSIQELYYKISGRELVEVFDKQKGECVYCSRDLSDGVFQLDHRVPLSREGEHHIDNIDFLCEMCNRAKHNTCGDVFKEALSQYAKRIVAIEHRDKEPYG